MTPEQKIKRDIINSVVGNYRDEHEFPELEELTDENIVENYDLLGDWTQDEECDYREGDILTDIQCQDSRHYESQSVAKKLSDGSWIGWTYWYGGGKYGEPEAIEWIDEAYELEVTEEEKTVTVRTFKKKEIE